MSHYHYWSILSIVFISVNPQDYYNEFRHELTTSFGEIVVCSSRKYLQEKCQKDLRHYHTPLLYQSRRLLIKSGNSPKRHTGRDEVEIRYPLKSCFSLFFLDSG
jgi:hypothetical protein